NVFFEGFSQREELPFFYAVADVFVMPSLWEPWGLVLNEAMSCALPVIASSVAGATSDHVVDGVDGYSCEPANPEQLARKIESILTDDGTRRAMGQNSYKIIQNYTPEACAQGFYNAIEGELPAVRPWCFLNRDEKIA